MFKDFSNLTDHATVCAHHQAVSGLMADARQVVNRARAECEAYSGFYGDLIPGNILCDRVSGFMHMFTLYWSVRPFGSSVLIATYDQDGPGLYAVEPSGLSYVRTWQAIWADIAD